MSIALVAVVFFASGFAALLYQVVWQRALFAIYGINVESVTVVVTAFMLGLGLGSLAGGAISKRANVRALDVFAAVELSIGVFGVFSLRLFRAVGDATLALSPLATALVTFLLVLFPTMMMGGTLPLLVAELVRRFGNVGRSVGVLYFVNTLGSAVASIAAALLLLKHLGQTGTIRVAAIANATATVVTLVAVRIRNRYAKSTEGATS